MRAFASGDMGVSSSELFLAAAPGTGNTEVTVLDVTYLPGAINPRHFSASHWNPSKTEGVRWLEFIVAEKGKGRSIRKP